LSYFSELINQGLQSANKETDHSKESFGMMPGRFQRMMIAHSIGIYLRLCRKDFQAESSWNLQSLTHCQIYKNVCTCTWTI